MSSVQLHNMLPEDKDGDWTDDVIFEEVSISPFNQYSPSRKNSL